MNIDFKLTPHDTARRTLEILGRRAEQDQTVATIFQHESGTVDRAARLAEELMALVDSSNPVRWLLDVGHGFSRSSGRSSEVGSNFGLRRGAMLELVPGPRLENAPDFHQTRGRESQFPTEVRSSHG